MSGNIYEKNLPEELHRSVKNGHRKNTPSYGRIKTSTIGGNFMPRNYRHIMQYEKEMMRLKEEGKTVREIGEKFGLTYEQTHDFFKRQNRKKRKIEAGQAVHKKGRPCKKEGEIPPSILKLDKLAQMRYVMASKDRYIKRLEMEIKLMQDFLSLTERK